MPETEDEFVTKYKAEIQKPYYIPSTSEIKEHPVFKKVYAFFTQTLIGKLCAFILVVILVFFLYLLGRGLYKLGWEEWKSVLALLTIPIMTIWIAVVYVA